MAHKVLSKDMAELVGALKLAERYSNTTLDNEYRKYEIHMVSLGYEPDYIFVVLSCFG